MVKSLTKKIPNWLLITAAVFVSLVFIITLFSFFYFVKYQNLISPGLNLANINLGGKSLAEAKMILEPRFTSLNNGVELNFNNKKIIVGQSISPDLSIPLIYVNLDSTLENIWLIGHGKNKIKNIIDHLIGLIFGHQIEASVVIDREAVKAVLKKEFSSFEIEAQDAGVNFVDNDFLVVEEKAGLSLNYDRAIDDLVSHLSKLDGSAITITSQEIKPKIFAQDIQAKIEEIKEFFNFPATKLVYENNFWDLTPELSHFWVGLAKDGLITKVVLDQNKIKTWLIKEVGSKVNKELIEPRLSVKAGRVSIWQPGQDGLEVDLEETAKKIADWPNNKPEKIELKVKKIISKSEDQSAITMGIKEIIGTGTSQFAGSPVNRRHNIKVGANSLHGLLIKPGEEFSLLKALGKIDGNTGYLPELVIKENKTKPEFGGGLCQIGTTMFRAAFNSGLPITQRRNHSYRVVYYEPAGTDATIYDPAPDFRFINDTGNYILIQARLSGNNLAFDFWGTKDGRQVEFTKPVIYNIIAPPPTKIIETTDLKEGEKKCTEKSHNGADAYFDYKVTYANGEVKQKRFSSHYVPWQAVCLVGVKELAKPTELENITNTITSIITPTITP